jgi:hypothetical protein
MVTTQEASGNQTVTEKSDGQNFYNKAINKRVLSDPTFYNAQPTRLSQFFNSQENL